MKLTRWIVLVLLLALWSIPSAVMAQGGIITYGETRTETLSDVTPQVLYALNGNAGEVVTVYAIGMTETFQPTITVLGPTGQVAFSAGDALSPIPNDARTTVRLPQSGGYSILVGSANPDFGTFTIAVRLTTPGISTQLGTEPVTLNIPPGGQSQSFTIPVPPDGDTPITIASSTPGFNYSVQVSAPDGRIILAIDGALPSVSVVLPANTEPYTVVVQASNATDSGTLSISQGASVPATTGSAPAPVATEEMGSAGAPPANQCATVAGPGGVNIRSGPGTDYEVIGGLPPNGYLIVTGQNNGWYTGATANGAGWVAGSVVTLSGPCNNLPFMNAPALPAATPIPIATTAGVPTNPTPTAVTNNPTATTTTNNPTPTYTPTEDVPIAAPDGDYNLVIDRDDGGQFSNDVSYPNGDTSDRIRITIDNLSNQPPNSYREMSILVTCFGDGAENLSWGTGGPNSPTAKKCNESLPATHTNDSNQTYVNINMSGNGYVNYTIIVTITS